MNFVMDKSPKCFTTIELHKNNGITLFGFLLFIIFDVFIVLFEIIYILKCNIFDYYFLSIIITKSI